MDLKLKKINWKVLVVSFVLVFSLGFIGSIFTGQSSNSEWYESIKPAITPPGWVFPIVWNLIFFLIALSLYFSWINSNHKERGRIAIAFGINFILNILWSFLYFGLRSPLLAFYEILLLEISIFAMIYVTSSIDKKSSLLLIPYLLWVSFAVILNYLTIINI